MQAITDTEALVGAYLRERAGLGRQLANADLSADGRARLQARLAGVDAALRDLGHPVAAPEPVGPPQRTAAAKRKQTRG